MTVLQKITEPLKTKMMKIIYRLFSVFFSVSICFLSVAQNKIDKIDQLVSAYYETGRFIGTVLVSQNGEIIFEKAFGYADLEWEMSNSIDTKYKIGSVSKQFTSFLILKLAEEGYVDLNTPIINYIPDYKGEGADKITLHQLMTHTSGIDDFDSKTESRIEKLPHTTEELVKLSESINLSFEPGQGWDYSNMGYMLLAYIAEKVTNISFEELLNEKVFKPLKMYDTKQYVNRDIEKRLAKGYEYDLLYGFKNTTHLDNSYVKGSGGIISTVHDLLKWDAALYSNDVISEESLNRMFTPYSHDYGYGFELPIKTVKQDTIRLIYHSGRVNGFQSVFGHIPKDSVCIVILENLWAPRYRYYGRSIDIGIVDNEDIFDDIFQILYNQDVELPKKSIVLDISSSIPIKGIDYALDRYYTLNSKKEEYYSDILELNALGMALFEEYDMTDESLKILELNIKENPDYFIVYNSYAQVLEKTGNHDLSKKYYTKAIEVYEKYPEKNKRYKYYAEKLKNK
jgi:CubicO group peptidase (beta-lactamase class C family)